MIKNLPSLRYDIFIKAFEKRVSAVQQEIERMRGMEQLYNLVKDALESAKLPNDQRLNLLSGCLFAGFRATPMDRLATFDPVVEAIGERLRAADLHSGEPAVNMGGTNCDIDFVWRVKARSVYLTIDVPEKGMADLVVDVVTRTTQTLEYMIARIELPSYPAPSTFKTVAERREAGIAALVDDGEILF